MCWLYAPGLMAHGAIKPDLVRARSPLMEMLVIAAPTVATMASYTVMQFVDKLMVSRIGADSVYVGAQGNGGLLAFVPISIAMGCLTVVNTFVSQNLGAKTPERAPAYAWAGLWLAAVWWVVFMLPYGVMLPHVLEWVRSNAPSSEMLEELRRRDELATAYSRVLIYGSIFTMAARGLAQFFYGMHRPMVVLVAVIAGNIVNFVLNTMLIFGPSAPAARGNALFDWWFGAAARLAGALGIEAHGIRGSAIATVIGTCVELAIPMAVFLSPKFNRLYGTSRAWRPRWLPMADLLRIGWPGALMFGNEMVCWAIFMVAQVGHFGTLHSTAGWIAHQWMSMSFMPTYGISIAITAMVGKSIGAGKPDEAAARAWLGLKVAVVYMTCCGIAFVLFRTVLVDMFIEEHSSNEERETLLRLGGRFLIATAAFQFFDGVAMSLSGALRGAGDTRWPGVATIVLSWTVIVGGGWALVYLAPGLESLGPWIAAAAYIILLSAAIGWRFLGGKWRGMKVVGDSPTV